MYFTDALRVLVRQLPIVIAGLLLIALGAVVAFRVVPTNHQASAQVLLLPPSAPIPEGDPVNPYLNLPGSLTLTSSLLAGAVSTPDARREMKENGFPSIYETSVVPQTGPLIVVTVQDTDPAAALATRDEVLRRVAAELESIQRVEDVPEGQLIRPREFGVSEEAEVLAGNRLRAIAVIVALGAIVTLLAAFAMDRWRARRATRSAAVDRPAPSPPADSAPSASFSDANDAEDWIDRLVQPAGDFTPRTGLEIDPAASTRGARDYEASDPSGSGSPRYGG